MFPLAFIQFRRGRGLLFTVQFLVPVLIRKVFVIIEEIFSERIFFSWVLLLVLPNFVSGSEYLHTYIHIYRLNEMEWG